MIKIWKVRYRDSTTDECYVTRWFRSEDEAKTWLDLKTLGKRAHPEIESEEVPVDGNVDMFISWLNVSFGDD